MLSTIGQTTLSAVNIKVLVITKRELTWLRDFAKSQKIKLDELNYIGDMASLFPENKYQLILLDDSFFKDNLHHIISEINRTNPLISVLVLSDNSDSAYQLDLIEQGIDDFLYLNEQPALLVRRLNLALQRNNAKRKAIRQNQDLHMVTLLSRRLHNSNHPASLIVDTIELVSKAFNLLGLLIGLKDGERVHIHAGTPAATNKSQRIYDVISTLHPYNPLKQSMDKGIVQVFQQLSLSEYMPELPIFEEVYSAIIIPLSHANITLGVFMVLGTPSNPLTSDDIVIYEHLATHLSSAYQNVRHYFVQDANVRANRHLLRTWQQLSGIYTSKDVGKIVRELVDEISHVKNSLVWIYSDIKTDYVFDVSPTLPSHAFEELFKTDFIDYYVNQFKAQMQPLVIWLGRSSNQEEESLFTLMEGQQLVFVPIIDQARLCGSILVSVDSHEHLGTEYINLLESIAYAAGQTLERNMLIVSKQEQTERLEAIMRSIKDGIFFVNDQQEVVFCNPQFTELTGVNPSQVLYNSADVLLNKLAAQSKSPEQVLQQFQQSVEQIINTADNQEYPIVEFYIPQLDTNLYVEFVALYSVNMERNYSWLGFLRSAELGQSSFDKQSQLYNLLAKNIQAYFTRLYSNIIIYRDQNNILSYQGRVQLLNDIEDEAYNLGQIWGNYQQLLLLDSSELTSMRELLDPVEIINQVLDNRAFIKHRHQIEVEYPTESSNIFADGRQISHIFHLLIDNALTFSLANSKVNIKIQLEDEKLVISVRDYGLPIPEERLSQLFTLSYHSYADTENERVGLDLYLAHELIRLHDGHLKVSSNAVQGTTMSVVLPITEAKTDIKVILEQSSGGVPKRKPSTIMIYDEKLDDNIENYTYLESQGYELIYCNSIKQVYDEVEMIRLDLILLAMRHKNSKILSLCEQLRNKKQSTVPIILLSSNNHQEERIRALRIVDTYSDVNITSDELLAYVENTFDRINLPERVREPLTLGNLHIAFAQREVYLNKKRINLTRIEYELLCMLALNQNNVLTHDELLNEIWGPEYRDEKQYLWVNVSRLRRKLEILPDKTRYIYTQPGVGYILRYDIS